MGFGKLQPYTYLVIGLPRNDPAGLISNVLIANLPQIILSVLYIFYNAMLSTFLVQREFSLMYKEEKRKTLRVSEPVGIQRGSYFISLPLRYGIPLYASSGIMHWLISQSLFLARITALNPADATPNLDNSFSTCGYSAIALIISGLTPHTSYLREFWANYSCRSLALLLGALLVVAILVLSFFKKYDGTMRMVATNSMAISAACHSLDRDTAHGSKLPVIWAVVKIEDGIGHCAFTTAPAGELKGSLNSTTQYI